MSSNNTIETNSNGEIVLLTSYGYGWPARRSARETANLMTASDVENLLSACNGNFSQLDPETAQALSIKAGHMAESRKEQEEKRREYRERKRQERHSNIMGEIRMVTAGVPSFTPSQIQLLAAKKGNGFPVRTRQMYAIHLSWARWHDGTVERVYDSGKTVNVIYADGKSGTQTIRGKDAGYRFIK